MRKPAAATVWSLLGAILLAAPVVAEDGPDPLLAREVSQWGESGPDIRSSTGSAVSGVASGDVTAFNPSDGLHYVLRAGADRLEVVDAGGEVVAVYDVSSVSIGSVEAMSFAPSTDATDDPDRLNLFVAGPEGSAVTELTLEQAAAVSASPVNAEPIRAIDASAWDPPAIEPSGIVWNPSGDMMIVVDSEVDETGWYEGVNLWEVHRAQGTVARVGTTLPYTAEPTGVGWDSATNTLFISDDDKRAVLAVGPGADGLFGTVDDSADQIDLPAADAEDPEFDADSGDLFVLGGVDREIYRIDPVDGVFGNSDDAVTSFDISHLGPSDFEGLASLPDRGTLLIGTHNSPQIYEVTNQGTLVRIIDISGSGASSIDGLARAASSADPKATSLWVADRGLDGKRDGMIYEVALPMEEEPGAPVAHDDEARTEEGVAVTVEVLANDADAENDALSVSDLTDPRHGTVVADPDGTVTYTPDTGFVGADTFTYRTFDGRIASGQATVTVVVEEEGLTPQDPQSSSGWFVDDDGHLFEGDIDAVAVAGITRGCNPPANDRFCPDDHVTRGQMAGFLVRALGLSGGDAEFSDTAGSVFEADISALATAGITRGCNPPANDRFCPDGLVTRGQMAAFLTRALLSGL